MRPLSVVRRRAKVKPGQRDKPTGTPMAMPPPQLLLLPLLLAAASAKTTPTSASGGPPPTPTPWPEQYHAVVLTNHTERGGRLELVDIYYDWPRGRTLNVLRDQLSGEPLNDILWANGSTYAFNHSSCSAALLPVGLLPPDSWIDGAAYVGRHTVDGFDCHVWSNRFYTRYYEEVATGRPVFWVFSGTGYNFVDSDSDAPAGILRHVLSFEVGGVPEKNSPMWQAPAYCFTGTNADAAHGVESESNRDDVVNDTVRFVHATASFNQ